MTGLAAAAANHASTGEAVQFWILGITAVLGALATVFMKQAVHSALALATTMIILAVFYFAQGAYFLGVVQIVVYTGAVMMLFLFVVMLVGVSNADSLKETLRGQRVAAAVCGLGFGILLIAGIANARLTTFAGTGHANAGGNAQGLARLIFTRYVWAFELTGALLITAAVGAMVLTHRERLTRRLDQRELAEQRIRRNQQVTPLPAPGVYARHNAVDIPALLPDGTPAEDSVLPVLRERGQVRDVSGEAVHRLAELENLADRHLGREPKVVRRGTATVRPALPAQPGEDGESPPPALGGGGTGGTGDSGDSGGTGGPDGPDGPGQGAGPAPGHAEEAEGDRS